MSESVETVLSKANSAFVDEKYDDALALYNAAVEADPSDGEIYVKRSHAHFKLGNWKATVDDVNKALDCGIQIGKAYLRKGISAYHLGNFEEAKDAFEKGSLLDNTEKEFSTWLEKCAASLRLKDVKATAVPAATPASKIRHDWYQTESHVTITILLKDQKPGDVATEFTRKSILFRAKLLSGEDYELFLELAHPIVAEQTTYKCYSTKVEIRAKKEEGIRWVTLELDRSSTHRPCERMCPLPPAGDAPPAASRSKDWDRIVKETDNEKEEGEAALNALFQKIYAEGTDEVKRAMNKSFVESGGTVLSTNWKEISSKQTPVKPPDGLEYRKWQD